MKRLLSFLSLLASAFLCCPVLSALAAPLFFDDFCGTAVDSNNWSFPTGEGSFYGRTQIRAGYPPVSDCILHLPLDTHNSTAKTPGDSFYGSEIFTNQRFSRGSGLRIQAHARLRAPLPGGMVGGLFLYQFFSTTGLHSEIDHELLSNEVQEGRENRLLTNVYANESFGVGQRQFVKIPSLQLTAFNTYQIDWLPDRVRWYINGQLVREETSIVPSEDLALHLNCWAPDRDFDIAYNSDLQPVRTAAENQTYFCDIDWVRVAEIPASSSAHLESPFSGSLESGIGLIRGWVCNATKVEVQLDNGELWPTAYGTKREDTASVCGDVNNGFGLTFNWNRLGEGPHTVQAFADGVEFADVPFTVTTLGEEFRTGLSGEYPLPNFPQPGDTVIVRWSEPHQNFVIVKFLPGS